jgi:hypothetical protein
MKLTKSQLKQIIKEELEGSKERVIGRHEAFYKAVDAFATDLEVFRNAGGDREDASAALDKVLNDVFPPTPIDMMHAKAKGQYPE